jgi:hypothetical protein
MRPARVIAADDCVLMMQTTRRMADAHCIAF